MKYVLVIAAACLVCFLPPDVIAATPDSTISHTGRPNSLRPGAWALQLSTVGSYTVGVYVKKQLKPAHALRLGANFGFSSSSSDLAMDTTSVMVGSGYRDSDSWDLHLELVSQHYFHAAADAFFVIGVGPFFRIAEYVDEVQEQFLDETLFRSHDDERYQVGAVAILGAEWFASRSLSLGIEYMIRMGYQSSTVETTFDYDAPPIDDPAVRSIEETSVWFFDAGDDVRFLLGIYF